MEPTIDARDGAFFLRRVLTSTSCLCAMREIETGPATQRSFGIQRGVLLQRNASGRTFFGYLLLSEADKAVAHRNAEQLLELHAFSAARAQQHRRRYRLLFELLHRALFRLLVRPPAHNCRTVSGDLPQNGRTRPRPPTSVSPVSIPTNALLTTDSEHQAHCP